MRLVLAACLVLGCGNSKNSFPPSTSSDGSNDEGTDDGDDDGNGGGGDCGDTWTVTDGVAVQPGSCLAWGPLSDEDLNWYDAVSDEDAELGGCHNDCPDEGDGWCATLDGLDGRSNWRVPSKVEVTDAANTGPPMDDIDVWMWTRDTDPNANSLAWKGNLSDGGASFGADKATDYVPVRCVSDP